MSEPPICGLCQHVSRAPLRPALCMRPRGFRFDVVHGSLSLAGEYCHYERHHTLMDRILRRDKCGPDGRYFKEKEDK